MKQRPTSRDPSLLRSLHYFEAVARLGSVSRAAAEVGVSGSAVSHQLRELTSFLGEDLVEKAGRGVVLTEAGRRLADRLGDAFSDINQMVWDVVGRRTQVLRLAVCSTFGPAWLAPRLPAFVQANPGLALDLRLYSHDPEQTHSVADAIVTTRPAKLGFRSVALFDETLVAVQRPGLGGVQGADPPQLIATDPDKGLIGRDWAAFVARTGYRLEDIGEGDFVRCTHHLLAVELAKAGMGVALVPDFLAAEALANGSLAYFDRTRLPSGRTYRLCYKEARAGNPLIQAVAGWMKAQAGGSSDAAVLLEGALP